MTSSNVLTTTFVETWPLRSWRFSHKKTFNDFIKEYNSLQTYVGKKLCVKEQQQRKAGDLWSNLGWELSVPEICVHQSSLRVRAYHFSVDENVTRISVRSCSSMQVKKHFTDINVPIFIEGWSDNSLRKWESHFCREKSYKRILPTAKCLVIP